jgi:pyrroline-5-carboxylate reductase
MRKIGFIGFGNMGSIMIKALLDNGALSQEQVTVFTRTQDKLNDFTEKYRNVEIAKSLAELATKCKRIFLCTGTMDLKGVLSELVHYLPKDVHLITITGTVEIKCVESIFTGRITKIMPTQIAEIGEGVTLICHNNKVTPEDQSFIRVAFASIGKTKEIQESQFDLASDLSSCAPAFYAAILNNLAKVSQKHGDLNTDDIKEIILPTAYGTTRLFMEQKAGFTDLISRVATKGGISEEGVKILDRELPDVFDELLTVTLAKREKIKQIVREQYGVN